MSVYLVIPCYNEEKRLPVQEFHKTHGLDMKYLFVDDGSSDQTLDVLKKVSEHDHCEYMSLEKNSGKAEAVRQGILKVIQEKNPSEEDWIGFWDADLSTPLYEVKNAIEYRGLSQSCDSIKAIWSSRVFRLGSNIQRSPMRHYLGRFFATVMYRLFKIKSYDSQCGAKLFRPSIAAKSFADPFVSSWIFDVEILLRNNSDEIIEYPVTQWLDVAGSKITMKESFRIFFDILKVRKAYKKNSKGTLPSYKSTLSLDRS